MRRASSSKFGVASAKLFRISPLWAAYEIPVAVALEDAAGEGPFGELRGGISAVNFAQRLHVVPARVEVGQHAVRVEADIHEVVRAGGRQQLGGDLLSLENRPRMQRVAGGHSHR